MEAVRRSKWQALGQLAVKRAGGCGCGAGVQELEDMGIENVNLKCVKCYKRSCIWISAEPLNINYVMETSIPARYLPQNCHFSITLTDMATDTNK